MSGDVAWNGFVSGLDDGRLMSLRTLVGAWSGILMQCKKTHKIPARRPCGRFGNDFVSDPGSPWEARS
ncbi:MAG: hypothetical protein MPK62_01305 [Alphaproteobacteria bacterium]|nr:hypothetical protein [Alphaproteobacteria bacterium]MDA8029772.1 hypothetical protein [Alphaproteobacteria bacterium]